MGQHGAIEQTTMKQSRARYYLLQHKRYYKILYYNINQIATLYYTVLDHTMLYNTIQHYTTLYYTMLRIPYIAYHNTTQDDIVY